MNRKKKNGLKSCTANREIDSIRRMIRINFDIDSCEEKNPFDRVRLKKDVKVRRSPISTELIRENILASGKLNGLHKDFQLLVRLIINTGMRPIEAIGLELEDFILEHEIPHVHVRQNAVRVLKTPHSERLLPLLGVSLDAAQKIQFQGGWGKRLGKNMYATTVINRHFKANDTFVAEKQSFYSLRHWFQDQLTQRGVVDRIQCQLMGQVVSAVWPVSDYVTTILMEYFYENLHAGKPVSKALREAQLHVRTQSQSINQVLQTSECHIRWGQHQSKTNEFDRDHRAGLHPYFWGAFTLLV